MLRVTCHTLFLTLLHILSQIMTWGWQPWIPMNETAGTIWLWPLASEFLVTDNQRNFIINLTCIITKWYLGVQVLTRFLYQARKGQGRYDKDTIRLQNSPPAYHGILVSLQWFQFLGTIVMVANNNSSQGRHENDICATPMCVLLLCLHQ